MAKNLYGADDHTFDALDEIREEADKRGWWSTYRLPDWLAGYVGLEHDATLLRELELELIPGLLQTEAYARQLHVIRGRLSTREIDRRVAARIQRQERLAGASPLQLHAVISEAALQRCAQHDDLATEQLRHVRDRAQWPNVDLRVLPFKAGLHGSMTGAFSLLRFPDGLLSDLAYQEYAVGGHVIDDESVVSQLDTLFGELRGQALGRNESLALISELAEHVS